MPTAIDKTLKSLTVDIPFGEIGFQIKPPSIDKGTSTGYNIKRN